MIIRLFIITLAFSLTSCTFFKLAFSSKLKSPKFAFQAYQIKSVTEKSVQFEVMLSAFNPNEIGLKNVTLDYELFQKDKRFLQGGGMRLELPPKDTARLVVPIEAVYAEVFKTIGPTATKLLLNEKTMPVRVDAVLKGNPTLYNQSEEGSLWLSSVKVSKTVDIPLTGVRKEIEKSLNRAWKKAF
jgi:hypothetical protein